MQPQHAFKKPTIKDTNRAYVRLFKYFKSTESWLAFLDRYRVEPFAHGMQRHGDCAVRVIDPRTGYLAALGLETPSEIKYHTDVATARSFWQESYLSDTQRRYRNLEEGRTQPSTDEVSPR